MLVFAGSHVINGKKVAAIREAISADNGVFQQWNSMISMSTLIMSTVGSAWRAFDGPAVGKLYLDTEGHAHTRYGMSSTTGGIMVVRPDGVFAFGAGLEELSKI